jgi:hypothetical protein
MIGAVGNNWKGKRRSKRAYRSRKMARETQRPIETSSPMNKNNRGERGGKSDRDKSLDDRRGQQQLECEEKAQDHVPNRKKSGGK